MSETTNSTISRPALLEQLKSEKPARSAWGRGIQPAAVEIVEGVDYIDELPASYKPFERALLGGAREWSQYSWGGCSLCCNVEIAERYMTPSGLKRYMAPGHEASEGFGGEQLLDMQARALRAACRRAYRAAASIA